MGGRNRGPWAYVVIFSGAARIPAADVSRAERIHGLAGAGGACYPHDMPSLLLLLLAAAPVRAQTRAVAPVEAPVVVPAAGVPAAAPGLGVSGLSAPGVLPVLSLPVSPLPAVAPKAGSAASASAQAAAPHAVAASPVVAAAAPSLPASAVPALARAAAPAAVPGPSSSADPFAGPAEASDSPLARFFAGAQEGGAPADGRRLFDGAAPRPAADLAPTADIPRMEYSDLASLDVDWIGLAEHRQEYQNLRFILTSDPARSKALQDFFRARPDAMNSVLQPVFLALRSVAEAPRLSGPERIRAVAGLLFRSYNALRPLVDDETMPAEVRARSRDIITGFISEWRVAVELLRGGEVRQALEKLEGLEAQARALEAPRPAAPRPAQARGSETAGRSAAEDLEEGWQVLPPRAQRVTSDEVRQSMVSLDGLKDRVDRVSFFLERLLTRHRLAAEKGFRPAFVEARRLEVLEYLRGTAAPVRRMVRTSVPRYMDVTLGRTWLGSDERQRPPYVWVPDHPGLRVEAEPGGVVVRALFETDIDDAKTLKAFKRSIESHWRGAFPTQKGGASFRTEVTVRVVPRGAAFSPDALRLKEDAYPYALPDTIALPKAWDFDAAAHEFGHIMGLPDEYTEYYAAPQRAGVTRSNPGSLMSGHTTGVVQPRHLLGAYRLLSVNSIRGGR